MLPHASAFALPLDEEPNDIFLGSTDAGTTVCRGICQPRELGGRSQAFGYGLRSLCGGFLVRRQGFEHLKQIVYALRDTCGVRRSLALRSVHERAELALALREFRFDQVEGDGTRILGWSCLARRRDA